MPPTRCTGVVLAGGAGTRIGGRAKGLLEVGGRRLVDRVVAALRGAADDLLIIANEPAAADWVSGVRVVGDLWKERGSLVGLHAALAHSSGAALVVGWDMPFLSTQLLRALKSAGQQRVTAVVPEGEHGLEPLCAYYPSSCREVAEAQLARGEYRLSSFLERLPALEVFPRTEVERYGTPRVLFMNVNTSEDLAVADRLARDATI
jgi:molybdopterin-guanine dinucleotide biosynthesis protein A